MKNYKPKVRYLEEYQVKALDNLGFYVPSLGRNEKVDKYSTYFEKQYGMCGGSFKLNIRTNGYYFGDKYCKECVKLESPYDKWWHQLWGIREFTDEVRDFYEKLNSDLGALVALGIIEEEKEKNSLDLEVYVIQSVDECEYHMGDGNMTEDVTKAEFYADEELAQKELNEFDEPDDFEIRKVVVSINFDKGGEDN